MIINSLRMRNICNHRDRLFQFDPRLNIVIGSNGSGKSTILDTMLWLLTGINRFYGKLQENISQLAEPDEPSFAEMCFQQNGRNFRIKRDLREETVELVIDGNRPIRGAKAAVAEMMSHLGTTPQWLDDHVFVAQGEIAGWFKKQTAERSQEMAALMGVGNATKAHDAIHKFMSRVQIPTTMADMDALTLRIANAQHLLLEAELQLAEYRDVPPSIGEYLQVRSDLRARYQNAVNAKTECERLQAVAKEIQAQQLKTFNDEQGLLAEQKIYQDLVQTLQPAYAEATEGITAWDRQQEMLRSRTLYENSFAELIRLWRTREHRPKRPANLAEPDGDIHRRVVAFRQLAAELSSDIKRLMKLRPGESCPTCGNEAKDCAHRLEQLNKELQDHQTAARLDLMIWEESEAYRAKLATRQQSVETLRRTLRNLHTLRESIPSVQPPTKPRTEYVQTLEDYRVAQDALQSVSTQLRVVRANYDGLESRLVDTQASLSIQMERAKDCPDQADVAKAEAESTAMQQRYHAKAAVEMRIADLRSTIQASSEQIDEIHRVRDMQQRVTNALEKLQKAKEILHHSAAPRMLTFTQLEQMQTEIDSELSLFNTPFRVTPDDNLTFWAEFLDGKRRQPDRRLSPGQRIILSLALRIAMNATFAGSINVLALDEPTAGLDVRKLECVPQAFARLRELSHHRGLQVFLVTHEERLIDTFDCIIELQDG